MKSKLPEVSCISRESERSGVKFGIWIEPEMVNLKVICSKHIPTGQSLSERETYYYRNQLVLDLSNPKYRISYSA